MLLKIIRYIKGYIRIRITGYSTERFLNACSHKGIVLWGLTPVNRAYEMNIQVKGFRQLKPIIRKTGTKVVIVGRFGLPFFLHKYRKRKLFFAGALLSLALVFLLSRYIWNIDIQGNLSYTDETLLRFLESTQVTNGMPVSEVDCARIVKDIRKEYNDIIWVSASIKGTRLIIQVKENEDSLSAMDEVKPEPAGEQLQEAKAMDIVADQDCTITKIVPRNGIPMVKEGQQVKAGEILVSGQVPVLDDSGTVIGYQYHKADADIQGRTSIEYQNEISLTYEEKEYADIEKKEYTLKIGSYYLRLGSIRNSYEAWEMYGFAKQLCIGDNFYLPICYEKRIAKPYRPLEKKYTKNELQRILIKSFQRYCKDLDKKGVEIIENNVKIYTGSEKAEAKGRLTVLTPIGTLTQSQLLEIPVIEEQDETGE
ncbi:sporulation protein YqfD [Sporofaciens musculi]|uniref:sporulation protein YqfD n=1 Tax=Sporofaciens musculi TaxID=2681861 RepID=UPI00256FBC56|nr:sporulation protein YqfD [Sporofaciens musculi]